MKAKSTEMALTVRSRVHAIQMTCTVAGLERMIRECEETAFNLDRQIRAEEDRTRINDPAHFAYSTFAKSASQRRDNLRASADALKEKLEAAQRELDGALQQLNRADAPSPKDRYGLGAEPRSLECVRAENDR